jgi:hypothetical protein
MSMLVLLSTLPLLAAGFLLDIFIHRHESLRCYRRCTRLDLCRARLGASGFVLATAGEWLDRIDRRFFRDRYDAQRVLQQVVLDVKEAKSLA